MDTGSPIVLCKRSGVSCFPFRKDPTRDCMLTELQIQFPDHQRSWPTGFEGGIAHRLDVPTSGQLLVARTEAQLEELRRDFTRKQLLKRYVFLTRKTVPWKTNVVSFPIGHDKKSRRKMIVQRGQNTPHRGKWYTATTKLTHLASAPMTKGASDLQLWQATMKTGVMHQIRLHAAFAGLALVGDNLYGGGQSPSYFPSHFALHHCGIQSERWAVHDVPVPSWWPKWAQNAVNP